MKKFSKLLLAIMDSEAALAKKLVEEAVTENPNVILTNAAHEEIQKLLHCGYEILKQDIPFVESKLSDKKRHLKVV